MISIRLAISNNASINGNIEFNSMLNKKTTIEIFLFLTLFILNNIPLKLEKVAKRATNMVIIIKATLSNLLKVINNKRKRKVSAIFMIPAFKGLLLFIV
jgi:hypothetical protein